MSASLRREEAKGSGPTLMDMLSVRRRVEFEPDMERRPGDWWRHEREPALLGGDYNDTHQVRVLFPLTLRLILI